MNFERLRQRLLEKAIQGRLVPQSEESLSLESIDQLGDVNKYFTLPRSWKWLRLSDVTEKISDGTHHSPENVPHRSDEYPCLYITAKNIKLSGIDLSKATYIAEYVHKEIFSRCNPEFGDVLFVKDGATTGVVALNTLAEPFSLLSSVALLKPKRDIDGAYLVYVMRSKFFVENIKSFMQGTGIPRVTLKILKNIAIPCPPYAEQLRIVDRLNELFAQIDKAEIAYNELQSMSGSLRSLILQRAIEGKLVEQREDEPEVKQIGNAPVRKGVPFEIPKKWKWTTIGDSLQYGSSDQVLGTSLSEEDWLLDLEDIEKGKGKLVTKKRGSSSNSNKVKFEKHDVLYGKLRPYLNKCIVADEDGFATTEIIPIRRKDGAYEFVPEYLKSYFMSPFFVDYANKASYGVKMPRLGTKDAKAAILPVPPIKEQRRIVGRLNKLIQFIDQI